MTLSILLKKWRVVIHPFHYLLCYIFKDFHDKKSKLYVPLRLQAEVAAWGYRRHLTYKDGACDGSPDAHEPIPWFSDADEGHHLPLRSYCQHLHCPPNILHVDQYTYSRHPPFRRASDIVSPLDGVGDDRKTAGDTAHDSTRLRRQLRRVHVCSKPEPRQLVSERREKKVYLPA